ncbi:hypothetical protein CONPUDRAFT_169607 [Coniophora puteana RWD-64-598 SS2]|uniref:Uncharacterized protein n=1 Tax=Coniophora puteana (strain RWD-64-598) TaxID=741705 RepID=A0A5M3M8U1_CONPW|nr:uncharacterized protein CONPUDRAFT_169607 [Coniophora puteana RWD-64-598 SS2]EIW75210.1 hypothetical protein CONPUDRAFT_169607 [Coniophora puteana RWD-64-598 SS2]
MADTFRWNPILYWQPNGLRDVELYLVHLTWRLRRVCAANEEYPIISTNTSTWSDVNILVTKEVTVEVEVVES